MAIPDGAIAVFQEELRRVARSPAVVPFALAPGAPACCYIDLAMPEGAYAESAFVASVRDKTDDQRDAALAWLIEYRNRRP